jgi:hypothetical protein
MSIQPAAKASTYTGQHNTETQKTNIHASNGILTHDPSNRETTTCNRSRGHRDRPPHISMTESRRMKWAGHVACTRALKSV